MALTPSTITTEYVLQQIKADIVQSVQAAKRKKVTDGNKNRLPGWHVSDFVSPCLRKSVYSKNPALWTPMSNESAGALFQGIVVHEHLPLSSINEVTMCYDIVKKENIDPSKVKAMGKEQQKNVITGTLDDLVKVGDEFIIVDKKTYNARGYVKKDVDPLHRLQVDIYKLQLKYALGIDVKYGCNVYLDKSSALDETVLIYETSPIDKTQKFLEETLAILNSNVLPVGKVGFLCNGNNRQKKIYCPYLSQCESDGGRDWFQTQ